MRDIALQERKLLEIARALIQAPRILLPLDEPTAMLTPAESVSHLFDLVHRLRQQGLGVVLVTHHLEEVLEHADRTSVLRDGANVGTFERRQLDRSTLVQAMLGGHLEQRPKERSQARAHAALSVAGLQLRGDAPGIDLEVRQGEIVAVVGLLGCGASTLLQRITGFSGVPTVLEVDGEQTTVRSPTGARRRGIGYVSSDRKRSGIVAGQSLARNVSFPDLPAVTRRGVLSVKLLRNRADDLKVRFDVRCESVDQAIGTLSGGNQQKALIGRWLAAGVRMLVLDEPTQGVDIGARQEIHGHLRGHAADGGARLRVTDLDEVLLLADRVVVMRKGEVASVLDEAEVAAMTRGRLLSLIAGMDQVDSEVAT